MPIYQIVDMTSAEVDTFRSRDKSKGEKPVGHYTQVVWAETEEVGCGFTMRDVVIQGTTYVGQVDMNTQRHSRADQK